MSTDAGGPASNNGAEVLSSLPRHRPGRRTSRRAAADAGRAGASKGTSDAPKTGDRERTSTGTARVKPSSRSPAKRARSGSRARKGAATPAPLASGARPIAIPAQGFEIEEDILVGRAVDPPSRFELATSIIELAGEGVEELVKTGVSAGGSLLKRTLELIPKP